MRPKSCHANRQAKDHMHCLRLRPSACALQRRTSNQAAQGAFCDKQFGFVVAVSILYHMRQSACHRVKCGFE